MDSKVAIAAEDLERNLDDEDIILIKEDDKLVIKDLEKEASDKKKAKLLKRQRMTSGIALKGEEMGDDTDSEEEGVSALRKKVKEQRSRHKQDASSVFEQTTLRKRDQKKQTGKPKISHAVQQSGEAYKSSKGKGDVLKAGQHEPYAYIKLNPGMLNRRAKKQAIETFADVVSHGKKTDKR